jgi:hypothetical protein
MFQVKYEPEVNLERVSFFGIKPADVTFSLIGTCP